jgi:hypothetical protein
MNLSMIEYIPIEMCQVAFNKIITDYFCQIYMEMKTKSPEEVTKIAKNLISDKISQQLFQ